MATNPSPFNADRDSNAGTGFAFDVPNKETDRIQQAFEDGLRPDQPADPLRPYGEAAFRGPQETPGRFQYPDPGPGGRLAE